MQTRYNEIMRRPSLSQLLPDTVELGYTMLITCMIILLGNAKLLLQKARLLSSADLIGQQFSTKVTTGFDSLSSFRFTGSVIAAIVWGGVGLVVYSALQAIWQAVRTARYRREFDSQQFVHPKQFTHDSYWRQIVADTILGFVLLTLLILCTILYVVIVLPASFAYTQRFIVNPGLTTALDPLVGIAITFITTTLLFFIVKLVVRHHRIASVEL
jgi:hypothetical protein